MREVLAQLTVHVERVLAWRYAAVASGLAVFIFTIGMVIAGIVPRTFFPNLEGDLVNASARMPYGTSLEVTRQVQLALEDSAARTLEELGGGHLKRGMYTTLGTGPAAWGGSREEGAHLVSIELELVPSDERTFSSEDFSKAWSRNTAKIPGIVANMR